MSAGRRSRREGQEEERESESEENRLSGALLLILLLPPDYPVAMLYVKQTTIFFFEIDELYFQCVYQKTSDMNRECRLVTHQMNSGFQPAGSEPALGQPGLVLTVVSSIPAVVDRSDRSEA